MKRQTWNNVLSNKVKIRKKTNEKKQENCIMSQNQLKHQNFKMKWNSFFLISVPEIKCQKSHKSLKIT